MWSDHLSVICNKRLPSIADLLHQWLSGKDIIFMGCPSPSVHLSVYGSVMVY